MDYYHRIVCILFIFCKTIKSETFDKLDDKFPCFSNSTGTESLMIKCNFCPTICPSASDDDKSNKAFTKETLNKFIASINQTISYLSISCLNLESIPDDFFSGAEIIHFRCYKCNLTSISSRAFSGLERVLTVVNLERNKLSEISDGFKRLKSLKKVVLGFNNISSVARNAFRNSENTLESLELQGNRLDSFSAFKKLKNLRILNICSNKIKFPPESLELPNTLESLETCGGTFSEITKNTFKGFKNLKQLKITDSKLKSIEPGSFGPLKNSIAHIILGYNELTNIDGVFVDLPKLEELYLYNNKINSISKETFRGLTQLKTLSILYNKIEKIDSKSFQNLTNVKFISLTGNKIHEIQESTFEGAANLTSLNLDNNNIEFIYNGSFNGLKSLEELRLSHNYFKEIKSAIFKIPSLKKLDLSNNYIYKIESGAFDQLNLTSLSLYNNNLSSYKESLFTKLPYLTERYFTQMPQIVDPPFFCIEEE